ncbi:hypothetical protein E2562_025721 [Oryza meyeriana var. granulata]|uniref:Uncharacterized protein n=1 Tax=Oryza meyeriana var. granulata TaxID=110450 RepID=A0A6G1CTC4_9ORYZ|nr:hypothetical protein E2562_025721 [Oryza meyeriana var. granulata]
MALFVDMAGRSVLLRVRPGEWGGKEDHVYVSGQHWDGWKVFPFGSSIRAEDVPVEKSLKGHWPATLWTMPCSCY